MVKSSIFAPSTLLRSIAALVTVLSATSLIASPAEARRHHRHALHHHHAHVRVAHLHRHHGAPESDTSGEGFLSGGHASYSAIVVDANSGRTIYGRNEDELRHPASVTKVMTLYLLFEQLEKGRLRLDSPLMISQHAAAQAPSKLGLAPGETIDVENAIKAVVTKSANDIACAIAENIGGDEESFAHMMTQKAHALGMSRTHYANASGLPNPQQITTAHDLAILGRAIQDRFPRYYRYFATHNFAYQGANHRNHNHLLGRIEGVDGIKTGYTRASGFNLLTSVRRGNRHIVAVVMGGRTAGARDQAMASLIEEHVASGAPLRTARAITENETATVAENRSEPETLPTRPIEPQKLAYAEPAPTPVADIDDDRTASIPAPATKPARVAAVAPAPVEKAERAEKAEKARPAFVPGVQKRAEAPVKAKTAKKRDEPRAVDGSTSRVIAKGEKPRVTVVAATTPSAIGKGGHGKADAVRPAKPGWMIQIGATGDAEEANALIARAKGQLHGVNARAFTEKVQKGKETLYRARFAGLDPASAEAACRSLKKSGFSCFKTQN